MIARSPKATWKYVCVDERPALSEEEKKLAPNQQRALLEERLARATVWHFEHLSNDDEASIFDDVETDPFTRKGTRKSEGSLRLRWLRKKLVGWDNFNRPDGTPVLWKRGALGGATEENIELISLGVRRELGEAIENEIVMGPDELKKSWPPSTLDTAAS